ncbi:GLPGLI family protein [Mucilaginibacter sp. UR6-11]|uniref:GLPGLI family protein n=1 Tax=Mucilaginibacter sp. UR6-11 TaxID=1435644 RepID=UPI001E5DA2BA|nr:GLPGLI family protein [Mucilaginibacter sp. UR6-11]MCC8424260.1 GLPGLI family protein [Mucilaginibacter sp. UR6-11]
MKNLLITFGCFLILANTNCLAQTEHFTTSGIIEFTKTSNAYAIIRKEINKDNESYTQNAFEEYKKTQPQFKVLKSTLKFGSNKTLFTPVEPETPPTNYFFNVVIAEQNSTVYTDLNTGISTSQKKVFEETFLLKDTVRKIKWKITDETREIAGYQCRRANALIMDSVYVVAFYTDRILVTGGPESFTGLPGMILGVALPHENVSWFATKITDTSMPESTIIPPKKGKPVNNTQFKETLNSALKEWGTYAHSYLKAFYL